RLRNSGAQGDDASHIRRIHWLRHAAKNHFIHQLGVQARPQQQRAHYGATELISAKRRQFSSRFAERSPDSINDNEAVGFHRFVGAVEASLAVHVGRLRFEAARFTFTGGRWSTIFCSFKSVPTPCSRRISSLE